MYVADDVDPTAEAQLHWASRIFHFHESELPIIGYQ